MKGSTHPETMGLIASQRIFTTSLSGTFSDSLGGESCGQWPGHGSGRACRGCPFQRTSKLTVTPAMRGRAWQVSTKPVSISYCPSVKFLAMATLPCSARGRCRRRHPGRRRGGPARRPARRPAPCLARPWSWCEFCRPAPLAAKKQCRLGL